MNLTYVEIMELFGGLQLLDSYDKIVRSNGTEQVAREPYKLSAEARLSIAININRIKPIVQAQQDAANGLRKQFINGGEKIPEGRMEEFREENRKLAESQEDVKLRRIPVDDLRLNDNPIPPTVLAMIQPVLKGTSPDPVDDEA